MATRQSPANKSQRIKRRVGVSLAISMGVLSQLGRRSIVQDVADQGRELGFGHRLHQESLDSDGFGFFGIDALAEAGADNEDKRWGRG